MTTRHSELALVLICVNVDGVLYLLFHRHRKWGDWSLVGGHVEAGEEGDWLGTAMREAGEELAPLQPRIDFVVEPLSMDALKWGPVPSRAKNNVPTVYAVKYYWLRFLADPATALGRLDPREFALIRLDDLESSRATISVSDTFERFAATLGSHLRNLPCSWPTPIHAASLPGPLERVVHNESWSPRPPKVAAR